MADITLTAAATLGAQSLRIGPNRIEERTDLAVVCVARPLGADATFADALKAAWHIDMPTPRVSSVSDDIRAVQTTADQIFLIFPHRDTDAGGLVSEKIGHAGYTTDQTDAWVILDLSGPDTRAALERICPIDLVPQSFPENAAARTVLEHLGALIVRTDKDRFLLMSARSSAGSVLHAVET
ncbi:MAG: sarcosine oxidase subunit gamma, partial [Pseudomonadota bacterium]